MQNCAPEKIYFSVGIRGAALNTELSQAYNTTPPFDIQDFTYDSRELMDVILGHLESTEFDGVTVRIKFYMVEFRL